MRLLSLALGMALSCALANASFIGDWELQNWTGSGRATISITPPSGSSDSATFGYDDQKVTTSLQVWTFSALATESGPITFDYVYEGFHAWFNVTAFLNVFAGSNVVELVKAGPKDCCVTPSDGFTYTGSATIYVNAGDRLGFEMGGSNGDSTHILRGTLTITNFNAPGSYSEVPEPASFGLLVGGAAMLKLAGWRRERAKRAYR